MVLMRSYVAEEVNKIQLTRSSARIIAKIENKTLSPAVINGQIKCKKCKKK